MAVVGFPELTVMPVVLDADDVANGVRAPLAGPGRLTGRVEFGGPLFTPVDATYRPDDPDFQAFVQARAAQYRFALAHMSINFPSSDPPVLVRAAVEVRLGDEAGSDETLAYSLFPLRAGTSYDVTRGFSISPSLKVGPVTAGLGSFDWGQADHGSHDFLLGGPELSAHPVWRFQRTRAQDLVGPTRLVMVVQVTAGGQGVMGIDLTAEVEQRSFRARRLALSGAEVPRPHDVWF